MTAIRKELYAMVNQEDASLGEWAGQLIFKLDAAVEDSYPLDEPRHPDLASGLHWPHLE